MKKKNVIKNAVGTFGNICMVLVLGISLSGISMVTLQAAGSSGDVVSVAQNQVGYHEGASNYNVYAPAVGVANNQPWCATFVWWVYQTAGVPADRFPHVTYATRDWFADRGLWHARGTYTPKPGDYVAFGSHPDHCGIVISVSGGYFSTVEGNSSDSVSSNTYSLSNTYVMGFGEIRFDGAVVSSGSTVAPSVDWGNPGAPYGIPTMSVALNARGDFTRWIQTALNNLIGAGLSVDGIFGQATRNAVVSYQQSRGLYADGIVGNDTRGAMINEWASRKPVPAAPATQPATVTATPTTSVTPPTPTPTVTPRPESIMDIPMAPTVTPDTVPTETPSESPSESPVIKNAPTIKPVITPSATPTQKPDTPISPTPEAAGNTAGGTDSQVLRDSSDDNTYGDPCADEDDITVIDDDDDILEAPEAVYDLYFAKGYRRFTLMWSEDDDVDGYQVKYSKRKHSGKKKSVYVSTEKITIKKLKAKRYFVWVRAYVCDYDGKRLYSRWKMKKIKMR